MAHDHNLGGRRLYGDTLALSWEEVLLRVEFELFSFFLTSQPISFAVQTNLLLWISSNEPFVIDISNRAVVTEVSFRKSLVLLAKLAALPHVIRVINLHVERINLITDSNVDDPWFAVT